MKKQNVANLIRYYYDKNETAFKNEALKIARYFDSSGDRDLAIYISNIVRDAKGITLLSGECTNKFIKPLAVTTGNEFHFPQAIKADLQGIVNVVKRDLEINKFLFEGYSGSGKTEAAKLVARLLKRDLYYLEFNNLIDSYLGETNKNIAQAFSEINEIAEPNKAVILFDEIDIIALDRINDNDTREMGRATSTILRELDKIAEANKEIVLIAATNLCSKFDKALLRRFDAIINFDRYSKEALITVAEYYFNFYLKKFKIVPQEPQLFRKIINEASELPYPGELKNIIKIALAFDGNDESIYSRRLYNNLIGKIPSGSFLYRLNFTAREIEILKGSKKNETKKKTL